ncbi:MAG: lamin tail domain-containing protein [Tepidisphaerales bacterium]
MRKAGILAAALATAAVATPAMAGRLVISEVLYNEVGTLYLGEWIEIFNGTNQVIDLTNYKIGDEETRQQPGQGAATEGMFFFPEGATIRPGEVQVVASGAARFLEVYGFLPTYEVGSPNDPTWVPVEGVPQMRRYVDWAPLGDRLNMSNTNDQAVLLGPDDEIVDAVNWGNTFFLNPGLSASVLDGRSWERIDPRFNTFSAADWRLATNPGNVFWTSNSTPGTIPVLPFLAGDFSFDGILDAGDVDLFTEALLESAPYTNFIATYGDLFTAQYATTLTPELVVFFGDFDGNGVFDADDIDPFTDAVLAAGSRPGASSIPEPAMLGLLAPAALLLSRRRR